MRDQIVLRGANAGDLDIIQVIENSSFGTFDRPFTPEIFRAFLSENPLGFRVAEISGRIVGYCYTTPLRRKIFGRRYEATICSLAVSPESRRKGTGTILVRDSIESVRSAGRPDTVLKLQVSESNLEAQGLYYKLGFRRSRLLRSYYGLGKDAIEMKLEINSTT
jgi:ribosomal protein S18 acetylase RimI-like enzyme